MNQAIKEIAERNNLELNKTVIDLKNREFINYCKAKDFKKNFNALKESLNGSA